MRLDAKTLLERRHTELAAARQRLTSRPGLALVWVGDDSATAAFIRAKERQARELDCQFFLHHFEHAQTRQLEALLKGLNRRADVDGIVLQLPLPKGIDQRLLIDLIEPLKDVDNLRGNSGYAAPTAAGIIDLLNEYHVHPAELSTIIIGDGLLVGAPLAERFRQNGWPFEQILSHAERQAARLRSADIVISCTGVKNLITPAMVRPATILIDGSGVDLDVTILEPLVKMITPTKGALGPLTVAQLFANLLSATAQHQSPVKP